MPIRLYPTLPFYCQSSLKKLSASWFILKYYLCMVKRSLIMSVRVPIVNRIKVNKLYDVFVEFIDGL